MGNLTGRQVHRVTRPRAKGFPPSPPEVVKLAEREYVTRWGARFLVVWSGTKDDGLLADLPVRKRT